MRTEQQIKRKQNELLMQKQTLQSRLSETNPEQEAEVQSLRTQLDRLEDMIFLLEWVLNEPTGSYHG
jgi:hypothetical protein